MHKFQSIICGTIAPSILQTFRGAISGLLSEKQVMQLRGRKQGSEAEDMWADHRISHQSNEDKRLENITASWMRRGDTISFGLLIESLQLVLDKTMVCFLFISYYL